MYIVEFSQDMAKMRHRTEVVYDDKHMDARSPDAAAALAYVAQKTGRAELTAEADNVAACIAACHFTYIEIKVL